MAAINKNSRVTATTPNRKVDDLRHCRAEVQLIRFRINRYYENPPQANANPALLLTYHSCSTGGLRFHFGRELQAENSTRFVRVRHNAPA